MQNQIKNFQCYEQQPLTSVTTSASAAKQFTTTAGQGACDARIVNYGTVACQIKFGDATVVAVNTAAAAGTAQHYLLPGEDIIVSKDQAQYFSAITDTGSTSIIVHAGQGN